MSAKKKARPIGPTFRTELQRRASDLGVPSEDLDRALIIGQIAGLLIKDEALKGKLAHKGAAVLRLVEKSERLSRDLDSADIRGQRVTARAIERALSTTEAKKVVFKIPVMQAVERAAEKVRAFLTRGEATDAYDLWWYWNRVLTTTDRTKLPALIRRKLAASARRIPGGEKLHERCDEMRANAEEEWRTGKGLVLSGKKPDRKDVDSVLLKFKARTPAKT